MEREYTDKEGVTQKKKLYREVKRDIHGKMIYTERKLHEKKGEGIYKEKDGITRNGEKGYT